MKIIPVIDILDGKVIHGVQGNRESYKLIKSVLTDSCQPFEVARTFKEELGLEDLYIADLDSIEGEGDNFKKLKDIRNKLDVKIMLDYGIKCSDDLNKDIVKVVDSIILGTETLLSLETAKNAISVKGKDNVVVSIDIKRDKLLSKIIDFKDPEDAIRKFHKIGIREFILLNIDTVGTMRGVTSQSKRLISKIEDLDLCLLIGGGIKSKDDIMELEKLGINACLISTALHSGKIKKAI